MCSGNCNCGRCLVCKIIGGIVALLLVLTTIVAAMGVSTAHIGPDGGWIFGTVPASIALITFIVSMVALWKVARKMCPCGSRACCASGGGCGCGGGDCGCGGGKAGGCGCEDDCGCAKPGTCPGCHKNPCVCRK